jgi:hypothetical protein
MMHVTALSSSRPAGVRAGGRPAVPRSVVRPLLVRSTPNEKTPEHFEPADLPRGECLLQDAR